MYGAILLNKDCNKVLLVTNFHNTNYSFPKGKVNENETGLNCAIREAWEEIGFSIKGLITENDKISIQARNGKLTTMYIITGIDEMTTFKTVTRGEIGRIECLIYFSA